MSNSFTLGAYISILQLATEALCVEYKQSKTSRVFNKQIWDHFTSVNSEIEQYIIKTKRIIQLQASNNKGGAPTFANIKQRIKTYTRPNHIEITPLCDTIKDLISRLSFVQKLKNDQPEKYKTILAGLMAIKQNNKLIIQQLKTKMMQRGIKLVDYTGNAAEQVADYENILAALSRTFQTGNTPRTASISFSALDSHSPISSPKSSFGISPRRSPRASPRRSPRASPGGSPRASTRRSPTGSLRRKSSPKVSTRKTVSKVTKSKS
jgi:hypothetical protein